jgi:hypothetical protein
MAHIVKINNPFEPYKETEVREHPGGISIATWLLENEGPDFRDFTRPTICIMDGRPVLRKNWASRTIQPNSVVNFVAVQGEPITIAYWVIAVLVVAAVAVALSLPKPTIPGELPEADPVFDFKGMRNQIRLGSPIEVPYGRNKLWPSYAARPYTQYINNEQYQFQLFCLGHGTFDDIDAFFEDTSINNFQDVDWEIVGPGEQLTLFPDNVLTSAEIASIELYGPNEAEYTGLSGPYILNPAGTLASKLEVDVSLPLGLFVGANDGSMNAIGMTALFEFQEIDDAGVAVGDWQELGSFHKVLATNTPQRYTISQDVTPGRYQVRGARVSLKDTSTKAANVLRWETARAFLPDTKDYGDVTLYALKTRASNNLNDNVSNRFNVIATRKLPIYDAGTETWSEPVATRGIIPAFCDLFRAEYGGQLADSRLDLEELWALHEIYEGLGWTFDWVFDQRGTLWESARVIARAGRAVPMLDISQITMIRDYEKTIPTAIYNQENIVEGTFRWDIQLAELDDYDGVEIEYIDPTTHLPETVKCLIGDDAGDNCEQIKFPGCKDRDRAYQEGIYIRLCRLHQRENITFETGLEGRIPRYGDLIKVVHDMPRWGQGGQVLSIVGTTVTLSEPPDFGDMVGTFKIGFRTKTGGVQGPYTVTPGATDNTVELEEAIDTSAFIFDYISERPLYYFGKENLEGTLCKIIGLTPSEDTVEIKAVVVTGTSVFECPYDPCVPPPPPDVNIPTSPPPNPTIPCLSVKSSINPLDPNKLKVSWEQAPGATIYHVEKSADNVTWADAGTTIGLWFEIDIIPGEQIFVRVKGVNDRTGASGGYCPVPDGNPGGPDSPPPPCDNDYMCLLQPVVPTLVSISCKSRGGTATLCGISEFVVASQPAKKYRRSVQSGTASGSYHHNDICGDPYLVETINCTYGVTCQYDPLTCAITLTGENRCVSSSGPDIVGVACQTTPFNPECGRDVEHTQTSSRTMLATIVCCPWSNPAYSFKAVSDDLRVDLQDEDTDEDALTRLKATLPAWDDIEWVPCLMLPCCASSWALRNALDPVDFDYPYLEGKSKIAVEGFTASGF